MSILLLSKKKLKLIGLTTPIANNNDCYNLRLFDCRSLQHVSCIQYYPSANSFSLCFAIHKQAVPVFSSPAFSASPHSHTHAAEKLISRAASRLHAAAAACFTANTQRKIHSAGQRAVNASIRIPTT